MSFMALSRAMGHTTLRSHTRAVLSLVGRRPVQRSPLLMSLRPYAGATDGPREDRFGDLNDTKGFIEKYEKDSTGWTTDDPEWLGDWKEHPRPTFQAQHKNPYIYDDRQDRRNFGDPLAEDDDLYSVWTVDVMAKPFYDHVTTQKMLYQIFLSIAAVTAVWMALALFAQKYRPKPHIDRTLPFDNGRASRGMSPGESWTRETDPDNIVV